MLTTRTEYNEIVENHSKKKVSTLISSSISRLTFVVTKSDNKSKDKEEIEGYSKVSIINIANTNSARTQKPKTQKKQNNLTKIIKQKVEKEKKYIVGKAPRSRTQEPTIVTKIPKDIEVEIKDLSNELERIFVETQIEKVMWTRKPLVPKKKFMDHLKETTNTKDLHDEIMDQRISICL